MSGRAKKAAEARKLQVLAGGKGDDAPILDALERLGFASNPAMVRFLPASVVESHYMLRARAAGPEALAALDAARALLLAAADSRSA